MKSHRGFSLVSAVFLLVVLAGLGAAAVRMASFQQQTSIQALRSAQALHAAKSGAAWAAYRALNGFCGPATTTLTEGGGAGFDVSVACSQTSHTEGTAVLQVFVIDVLAQAGLYGGGDYVSRRLQIKITNGA